MNQALEGSDGEIIEGRYRLIRKIGTGSMGAVFEAESLSTQIRVAVKLINTRLQDEWQFRARFEREAMVAQQLKSRHCAEVLEFGQCADGRLFLVMELLRGESLASRVEREGALPTIEALQIVQHVLTGVETIHNAGFIHRDLKPENIFLHQESPDEIVAKVVDFGIAKPMNGSIAEPEKLTSVGIVLGTPHYIAPDWMIHDDVDGRSDIYSLTVMLVELLIGQPPFDDPDAKVVMSKHLVKERPTLRERNTKRSFPQELESIVAEGWCLDRDSRYHSAKDMREDVESLLTHLGAPFFLKRMDPSIAQPNPSLPADAMKRMNTQIVGRSLVSTWVSAVIGIVCVVILGFWGTTCNRDHSKAKQQAEGWWSTGSLEPLERIE